MNPEDEQSNSIERIDEAAADWLAKLDKGVDETERRAFDLWLAQSDLHRVRYQRLADLWDRFDSIPSSKQTVEKTETENIVEFPKEPPRSQWSLAAFSAAAAIIVLVAGIVVNRSDSSPNRLSLTDRSTVAAYERHLLPDGSTVELNIGTRASFDFSESHRRIHLETGEAYFSVASDPNRPFVVEMRNAAVTAVGTQFNIAISPDVTEVIVTEGKVNLETELENRSERSSKETTASSRIDLLSQGQKAKVSNAANGVDSTPFIAKVSEEELKKRLDWKVPRINFADTPLRKVADHLNERNSVQIEFADKDLRDIPITASLQSYDPLIFADILRLTHGIAIETPDRNRVVLSAAKPSPKGNLGPQ